MENGITIALAAKAAFQSFKQPQSIEDIYEYVVKNNLYLFNTPEPITVLREQVRRHCVGIQPRASSFEPKWFVQTAEGLYDLRVRHETLKTGEPRRIHRAKDKEDVIQSLITSNEKLFTEIYRVMIFAAVYGKKKGVREPLGSVDSAKGIDYQTFANAPAFPGLLHLLTLSEWNDPVALSSSPEIDEDKINLFEEYVNGGLQLLRHELDPKSYSLDGMIEILLLEDEPASDRLNIDTLKI
jgi:dnd system-associated protein 4